MSSIRKSTSRASRWRIPKIWTAPEDGQANAALVKLIAKACGVPASRVALTSGATSRLKTIRIEADPLAAAASLAASLALAGGA